MSAEPGDALSQAIVSGNPGLAGKVHLVNGRPWCDGVNHTTMCDPRFEAPGLRARGATACLSHVHLDADDGAARPVTLHCARTDSHRLHSDEDHGIWWADVDEIDGDPHELVTAYQDLLGSIWLYIGWHYVTRQLTTAQKELFADAVDQSHERANAADPDLGMSPAERWWRE